MINFWWLLIGKDSQMTYHYIFYEINIVFNTIVDVRVTPNPALQLFLLSYWRQLLWTFQDFLYNRQANTSFIFQSIDRMFFLCVQTLSFLILQLHTELHTEKSCFCRVMYTFQNQSTLYGWVFVYELSGCGFESSCSHLPWE